MGYEYRKRITTLKKQTDDSLEGKISFRRALVLSLLALTLLGFLAHSPDPEALHKKLSDGRSRGRADSADEQTSRVMKRLNIPGQAVVNETETPEESAATWRERTKHNIDSRVKWLENSPFSGFAADFYFSYADIVVSAFVGHAVSASEEESDAFSIDYYASGFSQFMVTALLRFGFIFICGIPLWLLLSAAGYYGSRRFFVPKRTIDFLGVCNPGKSPFYSGIWGPLTPNNNLSGTDFSCPGLACPAVAPLRIAQNHKLGQMLRKYGVLNQTNLTLTQIILAYKDFPSLVEEERAYEEISEPSDTAAPDAPPATPQSGIVSAGKVPLEKCAVISLQAVLQAHYALSKYARAMAKLGEYSESEEFYAEHARLINEVSQGLAPMSNVLLKSLTPLRARALAQLPLALVVSAYLAIEAGKSLVFKRIKGGFTAVSRYPHLQARAVVQSIPSYHSEYNGEQRLKLRQAVIFSRRHGDFGRALTPISMPMSARALREWLEILFTAPEKRQETAYLTELDSHLDELYDDFATHFSQKLKKHAAQFENDASEPPAVWKGLPFKSVVLMPLKSVVDLTLHGTSASRQKRIFELMDFTGEKQANLSISARLPGFKRQAVEAAQKGHTEAGVSRILASTPSGKELLEHWHIARRVLTRFNWLSTRVGDYAVPGDGLVQAVVIMREPDSPPEVVGLDSLVPLRDRRFKQLFGADWERKFYHAVPHPNDIEALMETEEFDRILNLRLKQAKDGTLDTPHEPDFGTLGAA